MERQQQFRGQAFSTSVDFWRRFGSGSILPHQEDMDGELGSLYGPEAMRDECESRPGLLRFCDDKPASGDANHPQQSSSLKDTTRSGSSCPEEEAGKLWVSSGPVGAEVHKGNRGVSEQMSMPPCQADDGHRNFDRRPVFGQDAVNFECQGWMWLINPETSELRRVGSALSQTEVSSVRPNSEASPKESDYISQQDDVDRTQRIRKVSSPMDFVLNQEFGVVHPYGSTIAAESCTLPEISRTPGTSASAGADPFAPVDPFRACPPCSTLVDVQFPDRHFTSVGMHGFMSSEENVNMNFGVPDRRAPLANGGLSSLGSLVTNAHENPCEEKHTSAPDFENPDGKNHSWARLGVEKQQRHARSKFSEAFSRLARKERMDRTRRTSSFHANRGLLYLGEGGGVGSSKSQNSSFSGVQSEVRTLEQEDREDLQFLLQKELKPSDVGALGRIVIPKKDAESSLPQLLAKEGIELDCEDYDTGEKIMLRFRYWPNNKSRMYLLQNTGDFVKAHHLRQYDKMLLYRNKKLGTYIIRACIGRDGSQDEDVTEGRRSENIGQNCPQEASTFSPCVSNAAAPERSLSTGVGVVELLDARAGLSDVVAHRTNLMNFADLPHVAMGEGMDSLMTFPSLEFVDVESIEF